MSGHSAAGSEGRLTLLERLLTAWRWFESGPGSQKGSTLMAFGTRVILSHARNLRDVAPTVLKRSEG
jgi:hypothetical protein